MITISIWSKARTETSLRPKNKTQIQNNLHSPLSLGTMNNTVKLLFTKKKKKKTHINSKLGLIQLSLHDLSDLSDTHLEAKQSDSAEL